MNTLKNKKTIPLNFGILIILLIAIAAAVLVYVQYDQKMKFIAATEESTAAKDSYVMSVFERIESNLAKIREKESVIRQDFTSADNDSNLGPEEKIQNEIDYIGSLIDENNRLIASLNQQVDEKDSRMKKYEITVKDLKSRISEYQENVDVLLAEKEALQFNLSATTTAKNRLAARVDTLNNEITRKSSELTDQKLLVISKDNDLNKAYYAIGTYKELRDKNILQKEGGFLGINRVTSLTGNPDEELFQVIDIRDITKIPLIAKRWEIVTGQDPSSYELACDNNQSEWIQISDPEKFWKKSKYLVIVIRDKENDELALSR
jgi:flagellar biosynthesis chaperone FliJ